MWNTYFLRVAQTSFNWRRGLTQCGTVMKHSAPPPVQTAKPLREGNHVEAPRMYGARWREPIWLDSATKLSAFTKTWCMFKKKKRMKSPLKTLFSRKLSKIRNLYILVIPFAPCFVICGFYACICFRAHLSYMNKSLKSQYHNVSEHSWMKQGLAEHCAHDRYL